MRMWWRIIYKTSIDMNFEITTDQESYQVVILDHNIIDYMDEIIGYEPFIKMEIWLNNYNITSELSPREYGIIYEECIEKLKNL